MHIEMEQFAGGKKLRAVRTALLHIVDRQWSGAPVRTTHADN